MIAKIEVGTKDKEALLAILVARVNDLIEAEKNSHFQQSS